MASEIQIAPSHAPQNPATAPQNSEPATAKAAQTQALAQEQAVQQATAPSAAEFSEQKVEELKETVAAINDFMSQFQRTLNFSVDQDGGQTIIKVIDTSSDELVRQIPSEDFLKISKHIEQMNNLLFSEKA